MRRIKSHALWIGHIADARDVAGMSEAGIEVLVQLAVEEPPMPVPRDLVSLRVPILDGPGNSLANLQMAVSVVATLIRQNRPTLVCCSAGMSRSPAVVAVALAEIEGRPPAETLQAIAECSPVDVSPGLWDELCDLANGPNS